MKKKETDLTKIDSSVLFRLIGRSILFLAMMTVVLFLFYACGNFQLFLDRTQRFIMLLCSITSIILIFFCLAGMIESVALFFIHGGRRYWIYFTLCIFTALPSAAVFLFMRTVAFLADGI